MVSVPTIYVVSQDKRLVKGIVTHCTEFNQTLRFGAASETNITVPEKIYNTKTEEWQDNPVYNELREDNLLYITDSRNYFDIPVRSVKNTNGFYNKFISNPSDRLWSLGEISYNPTLFHTDVSLQKETELFDIGSKAGYTFNVNTYIGNDGSINKISDDNNEATVHCLTCSTFIPVSVGDILALSYVNDNELNFRYTIACYTKPDPTSFTKFIKKGVGYDPSTKTITWDTTAPESGTRDTFDTTHFKNQTYGYIRIFLWTLNASKTTITESGETYTQWHWEYPSFGWIKIFSGVRRCTTIANSDTNGTKKIPLRWFTITNIAEEDNGVCCVKKITANSYEYTLCKKTISLSNGTLPLYVPPAIINIVNSSDWVIDKVDGISYTHSQHMEKGLLNQILEHLPHWKIGYISKELMTKYRTFENVDNANIYSFLTNEVQSAYQCFFVFNSEDCTISAYTLDDIRNSTTLTHSMITWNNAIKVINQSNNDTTYITAMRIHTADDQYGIGLVNPTGNNIIYDFSNVKSQMDFIADEDENRTLLEAVDEWENFYKNLTATEEQDSYLWYGKYLIQKTQEVEELNVRLTNILSEYRAKADTINAFLESDYKDSSIPVSWLIADIPRSVVDMTSGVYKPLSDYANYHSSTLYFELRNLAEAYQNTLSAYNDSVTACNNTKNSMQQFARKLSFQCGTEYETILSEKEKLALDYFIKEGDWQDSNAIFSDTYSVDDIYGTLKDVFQDATKDLKYYYSSPTYQFDIETANLLRLNINTDSLFLGKCVVVEANNGEWRSPFLLEMYIDHKDDTGFNIMFSTDYKRHNLAMRFADLFNSINQTSVKETQFTFDS